MKEETSDFLKYVKKYGEIKDVEEAFKEFPPEEEWHKGRIENVLREKGEVYNLYKIGDIVYVNKYYYLDGSVGGNHFFVIIEQDNIAVPIENLGMLISSRLEKLKYKSNVELKKDEFNNLDRDSIVKTDAIYKIPNDQILFKMGEVSLDKIEEYKKCYRKNKKSIGYKM